MATNQSTAPIVGRQMVPMPIDLDLMENKTEFCVVREVIDAKWKQLEHLTGSFIKDQKASSSDRSCNGTNIEFTLGSLFERYESISPVRFANIVGIYVADEFFDGFNVKAEVDGLRSDYLEGLQVDRNTIDSMIESFYVAFQLCRSEFMLDYQQYTRRFLFSTRPLIDSFEKAGYDHCFPWHYARDLYYSGKMPRPLGIRVSKRRDRFYVSCMALHSSGIITDKTVRIDNGRLLRLPNDTLFKP